MHNDYTRELAPKFEIFQDRIEITSAGALPEGLSESEFFEGFSVPRNKELMRVFKDVDLVEQLGSGIPRILETYGKECFQFSANFLRMVFPSAEPVYKEEEKEATKEGLADRLVDRLVDELAESQQKIIQLILNNPKISKREMAESIGISTTAIDNNIKTLKEKDIIERIGSDRSGYWKIITKE